MLSQSWSTNSATLMIDTIPQREPITVMGMMGTAGSLGGICIAQILGWLVGHAGYATAFVLAETLHPAAFAILAVMLRGRGALLTTGITRR